MCVRACVCVFVPVDPWILPAHTRRRATLNDRSRATGLEEVYTPAGESLRFEAAVVAPSAGEASGRQGAAAAAAATGAPEPQESVQFDDQLAFVTRHVLVGGGGLLFVRVLLLGSKSPR